MKTTKVKKVNKMDYSEDENDPISEDLDSKKENNRKKPTRMKRNLKKGIELKGVKRKVLQNEYMNEDSTSNSEIEMTDLRKDDDTDLDDVGNRYSPRNPSTSTIKKPTRKIKRTLFMPQMDLLRSNKTKEGTVLDTTTQMTKLNITKLPSDNVKKSFKEAVLEFVEQQKINDQLSSWKLQLDITIAESIRNSIDTVIDRELKKILATISNSFKELGDRLDTIDKSLSYTMERKDSIETRVTQVESQLRSRDDVTSQVNLLQDKIDAMEQQARLYKVEIANCLERRDENLLSIIEKIGCVIKHPLSKSDIVSAHRALIGKIIRDNFITAAWANKGLKSDQLAVPGTIYNVYINEHLTANNKQLFRLCRQQATKHNYKFTWIKHGTVLVRQTETPPMFAIRSEQDLKKIKS
ncbi:unnamed protein product [Parnassius apollo]|uniref:(apollo) hypothetical protein n=1 Tax=Parnassius apollo TaxID=110799 RepID=A0A8S3XS20_PARAO|nr:unnamed protein product [Parnassius apollo]